METLGRYKILKEIGRGSMGVIYLGYDPEIGRTVAIKTIRWDLIQASIGAEEALKRFKGEVKIVGQFSHPNIVTLYDTGEYEGNSYFVMEYVEGRTLASLIRTDGAPSVGRAAQIIESIAKGLSYAHGKGVIHRDIKPSNVMVSNEGEVKITDFGIARCTAFSGNMTRSLTGTPKYISPEQVDGKNIDHRADIFSLGVVAYELLTGMAAFEGESLTEIIHRVVHEIPSSPSSVNPAIPAAMDAVVMRAMEKDPARRYPDMITFGEAVLSAAEPEPLDTTRLGQITTPGPGPDSDQAGIGDGTDPAGQAGGITSVLETFRRYKRETLSLAGLVVLGLLISNDFGGVGFQDRTSVRQALAQGITMTQEGQIEAATALFKRLVDDFDRRDMGLTGLAYISLREGDSAEAMELCGQALESNPENLYARVLRATVFFHKGETEKARAELTQALDEATGAKWEESEAYTLLGRIQEIQGKPDEAMTSYEEAILRDPTNSLAYKNKGLLLARRGDYQGALASFEDVRNVKEDPGARILASESRRRLDLEADREKRERIRALIKDLNQQLEDKKDKGTPRADDPWRPRPLTVCVYPFEEKGVPSLDASRGILFQTSLYQAFAAQPRLSMVNREILDAILQELQIAQSELADREKALHVGQIAGANVIVTGTLFHLGESLQAIVQVIETETTYVKGALSEEQHRSETLLQFTDRIASKLSGSIVSAFPLKGKIRELKGEEVLVDFGRNVGATKGMKFKVLPGAEEAARKKKAYIGILTLTEVLEEDSLARLTATYDTIRPGQRIVEYRPEGTESEGAVREGA
jgi:serine/threonine protein kinase/tetratricopeptide (TPR) repeat protein